MKDVAQYPIKWGFGITSPSPWSPSHPHQGVDRSTPKRTPLTINGQTVAYTGNTGGVDPHHHLQKVKGGKVLDPQNGGFILPDPVIVYQVDNVDDTNIGKALRVRDGQGVEWSHFHLDEILVNNGQIIGRKENDLIEKNDIGYLRIIMTEIEGWPSDEVHSGKHDAVILGTWVGKTWEELIWHAWEIQPVHRQALVDEIESLKNQSGEAIILKPGKYQVK